MTNQRTPAGCFCAIMLLAMSLGLSGCGPGQLFIPAATPNPILPPLNAKSGDTWVSPKDGMTLIYIPAGEFLMGSADSDGEAFSNEKPQHRVYVDAYWIDQTEVTQGMYARCMAAGKCLQPICSYGGDNYPVVCMAWYDAAVYCAWAGRRLPIEAEWEKAARGTDGRKYPWGNQAPDSGLLNFNRNVGNTIEVGHYPGGASPYGVLDMSGNVTEWMADL